MQTNLKYLAAGGDIIATLEVGGECYKETWSKFTADGELFTATPIQTQLKEKLFAGASSQLQKAVSDLSDVLSGVSGQRCPPVAPLLSFISFVEGISAGKYKCTATEFAKLRGYVDVVGILLSIDKPKVYAALIDPSTIYVTEEAAEKDDYDDVTLANGMLLCVLRNRELFDSLYTCLEEHIRTYALADANVYFNRAIPDLIGHIRGDLYGTVRDEAIRRFGQWAKVENPLSLIGNDRIVNLESGVTRILTVLSSLRRLYTEVKELKDIDKGVLKKVILDLDAMITDMATTLVGMSYDFSVASIEAILNNPKYVMEDVAHLILAGSVDNIG